MTPSRSTEDGPEGDRIQVYPTLEEARKRFGENYGSFVFRLNRAHLESLSQGKVVAFDISGREYTGFLVPDAQEGATAEKRKQ